MTYDEDRYFGCLLRGDLRGAMAYLAQFPECKALYRRYTSLFSEDGCFLRYEVAPALNKILLAYQRYYKDVFYLSMDTGEAAGALKRRLAGLFQLSGDTGIGEMEQGPIADAFEQERLHFLGGKTGGYYGPYVWRTTETTAYRVELPEETRTFTVRLLDGFVTKGWIDYLSFGKLGTGGWTDGDGVLCCVMSSYDLDSAKLVELIYSSKRNLLPRFAADGFRRGGAPLP